MASLGLLNAVLAGFDVIAQPVNFVLLVLATILGVVVGMLPGLGGVILLGLLIPLTFGLEPVVAFMVLAAANGGTSQGGALTAILINTPGKAPNAATILDGYPLARQGRAGEAIGVSATASALGAILGISVLLLSIPVLLQIVLLFGSPEVFWLGIWGLTILSVVVRGSVVTGLLSGAMGLFISMHGVNSLSATTRWTYGLTNLLDGVGLVPALIGLFAVAEMIKLVSEGGQIAKEAESVTVTGGRIRGIKAVFEHWWVFLRAAFIGLIIGIIPGVGGVTANFVAYFQAAQSVPDNENFGKGDIRGVIASEASNDAKEGGAYIPTLAFGVPGSASMAVLFGAFLLHGITPGPLLIQQHLDIVAIIVLAALVSNVLSSVFTLAIAEELTKVTRIDITYLAPAVLGIALYASYALANNLFNMYVTMFFGILGFLMMKGNMSRIPMILAMVLGPIVEANFFRSMQISRGDPTIFVRSPLTWFLILLIVVSLLLPYLRRRFSPEEVVAGA